MTALEVAIMEKKDESILELILASTPEDFDDAGVHGSPLRNAIRISDVKAARFLLTHGADPNQAYPFSESLFDFSHQDRKS